MRGSVKLGKIFGIQIGLHYTWFIIAALIAFSLTNLFAQMHPNWSGPVAFLTALATALLFFVTLLLHELAHCLVARMFGIPVHSIDLFALGGVSNIEKEASSAKAEFLMAVVGPLASFVIGVACIGAAVIMGWTADELSRSPIASALAWLGQINLGLALFNLIPGFPLDGGRVLKAIIWGVTKDADKSALAAAYVGKLVAVGFIVFGIGLAFASRSFGGLWLALIGWFLSTAADAAIIEHRLRSSLKDLHAADAMSTDWSKVSSDTSLDDFAQTLARTGHRYFFVHEPGDDQAVVGVITPQQVTRVPRSRWRQLQVKNAMIPIASIRTTDADASILDALEIMMRDNVEQLPVLKDSKLVGILTRSNVVELFETRAELGRRAA